MALAKTKTELVDFGIVTALKVELDAVLRRLDDYESVQEDDEPLTYYYGHIHIPRLGESYTVVVTKLLGMGNDEAAISTTRLVQRWCPANVIMVGIAGGVAGKVSYGDVVVAQYCYYYEQAKLTTEGEEQRQQQFWSDKLLYGRAEAYEASEWKGEIGVERPDAEASEPQMPEAHFGPIGSGEKVVADEITVPQLLKHCPKMLALAMEGAGVARAAAHSSDPPRFLEVRGISDLADANKNDGWRSFAANAAASFTVGLLRSGPFRPAASVRAIADQGAVPLLVVRAQSLRPIAGDEVLAAFGDDLKKRDIETVALDFNDLVQADALAHPEQAVERLADEQGTLYGALARRGEAELVFHGLVHIPLAVLAGHIVTDRQQVRLFDYHPTETPPTWAWQEGAEDFPTLNVVGLPERQLRRQGEVVIRVSISYAVLAPQTRAVVPRPALEIEMSVAQPVRDIVRSEEQTREYGRMFRRTIDLIAQRLPACRRIHLFYSGPVSLAFHLGQQISQNIHPPVTVWNFRRNAYEWGVDLSAAFAGSESAVVRPPATN